MMDVKNRCYRFDGVAIDVQNLRVTVCSEIRPLEPKSFRLLVFLVENPGRVLPKDEIMAAVWSYTFVSENSLARAIAQVRKALDDDPKAPRYVETVPGFGYRFGCQGQTHNDSGSGCDDDPGPKRKLPHARLRHPGRRRHLPVFFDLFAVGNNLSALDDWSSSGLLAFQSVNSKTGYDLWTVSVEGDRKPRVFLQTRFDEKYARFSPDSRWLAYTSNASGRTEMYIRASGAAVRQISADGGIFPAWRHDGGEQFDVSPGGRFLINSVKDSAAAAITLLQNWKPR